MKNENLEAKFDVKPLYIRDRVATVPIVQGGMGVGVSMGRLAGAVAKEGAVGVISTAQIGFYMDEFEKDPAKCNLYAIQEQIQLAKNLSEGNGIIGANIMVALKHYEEHVRACVAAGVDLIISGAGLPLSLPEYVEGSDVAIAPIVSSARCVKLILTRWQKKYKRNPDMIVIEGPKAGGHLGFTKDEMLNHLDEVVQGYDNEIVEIIKLVREHEKEFNCEIPVIVAGGIFDNEDIKHALSLGANGVQIASRFVATDECDASQVYKEAYINAKKEDVRIIESPVGMPGRALNNSFAKRVCQGDKSKITKCYQCISHCNPKEVPYCITQALIRAVKGDIDNGLVFCGDNVDRIDKIVPVGALIKELMDI